MCAQSSDDPNDIVLHFARNHLEKNVKIWVRKFDEVTGKTVYQTKLFDVSGEELQRHLHQERKVFIDIETSNIRIKKLKLSEKSNTKDESAKDCAKFWGAFDEFGSIMYSVANFLGKSVVE